MYEDFKEYLLKANRYEARNVLLQKNPEMNVVEELVVPALIEIGDGWQNGVYSLSQVYISSMICEELSEELFSITESRRDQKAKIAIVTFDDYHTFGKKLVTLALRSAGYEIFDFGMIFDENNLIDLVKKNHIDILLFSVLMLPPALKIKDVKEKLLITNPKLKCIVGGAPFRFDEELRITVGADATGKNPQEAIRIIEEMEAEL